MIVLTKAVSEQALKTRLLILDVDGVLTDGRLYYSDSGSELKGFSTQDGAALKLLMGTGIQTAIITGRSSALVTRRAEELGISHYYHGSEDKHLALEQLVDASGISPDLMAHVGDDLPDLVLFNRVGLRFAVPGAHPVVLERADYTTTAQPGSGAVREVCQLLMTAQGSWDDALARYDR
jgi:3-deoxy-D-manno-octulosonate 8-phosphate phosphatase (KDO 8-P phosphatase)